MHNVVIKQISNNKINGNKVKKEKKIKQLAIYIQCWQPEFAPRNGR